MQKKMEDMEKLVSADKKALEQIGKMPVEVGHYV